LNPAVCAGSRQLETPGRASPILRNRCSQRRPVRNIRSIYAPNRGGLYPIAFSAFHAASFLRQPIVFESFRFSSDQSPVVAASCREECSRQNEAWLGKRSLRQGRFASHPSPARSGYGDKRKMMAPVMLFLENFLAAFFPALAFSLEQRSSHPGSPLFARAYALGEQRRIFFLHFPLTASRKIGACAFL
jgi:hypothetical protein